MDQQNKDKQIEEMAKLMEEARIKANVTTNSMNYGFGVWYAKELYEKGYRKASDVVKAIITEVKELITEVYDSHIYNSDLEDTEKEAIMDFTNDLDFTKIENKYIFSPSSKLR